MNVDESWFKHKCQIITTELLGKARIPNLPYVNTEGLHYRIDTDYFGTKRNDSNPISGPIYFDKTGEVLLKVK